MKITTKDGKSGKKHIYCDGEYSLTVDSQFWYSLAVPENAELDGEQFEQLKETVGVRRAFNKGAELLSIREHSRFEIIRKLKEKGYPDYAEQAADKLCEYGYIDDWRFSEIFVRELSERKKMGVKRILQELYKRGISRDIAAEAVALIDSDPVEQITELLSGKLNRYIYDDKGINKCYNTLIRLGYSPSDIRRALSDLER